MELNRIRHFVASVFNEGNRLQKTSIKGNVITKRRFTQTQILSALFSAAALYVLPKGFDGTFAGYIISFLGIFIGLFTGIVMSLHDKKERLLENILLIEETEKARRILAKNYMIQFTGLTAYSIIIGLIVALLLCLSLLTSKFQINIFDFSPAPISQIAVLQLKHFVFFVLLLSHRFFTVYFLLNFFVVTIYAISSYFSFILSDYKRMRITNSQSQKVP